MYSTNACCFIGHREINETEELKSKILGVIENLIVNEKVDTFLFGSKSRFDSLCLELVTKIKQKYPYVRRVYVRAEYANISSEYKDYLLKFYDDTYYPERLIGATKAIYVKRNCEMIDCSRVCLIYCKENCYPKNRKSGAKIALEYATGRKKTIYLFN